MARFPLLPGVLSGETADVYFLRTRQVLEANGLDPTVGMEVFPRSAGVVCGVEQVAELLQDAGFSGEVWSLSDGESVGPKEAAIQILGRYSQFGVYETALLGILASCTGWATAARQVVEAAGEVPVISFGARHTHPNVAPIMDHAAIVGGCETASTPLGAALAGKSASGTMPHAMVLIFGDTLRAAQAFDRVVNADVPRLVLVDTFQDEVLESVRVAEGLGQTLQGVRLDTPGERGGVTPALVHEVRARLDQAGFASVRIVVSGGITPDKIRFFQEAEAPVDSYGVGSYISGATPIDFTADIKEIEGNPVAKRGRIPGMSNGDRLRRLL